MGSELNGTYLSLSDKCHNIVDNYLCQDIVDKSHQQLNNH